MKDQDNIDKAAEEFVVQAARDSLVSFEIATDPSYVPSWHHRRIARELEHIEANGDRDYKILIVTVPPRHGKSQQCSIDFPAWYFGRHPRDGEIIAASYAAALAQDFGSKTRDKVNSEEYQAIFPGVILRDDEKARGRWRTSAGGSYVAVGVGGPITGRGAKILIIDDPLKNRKEAESKVVRDAIWSWFTSTAFTRLAPGGVVVIILTRWHTDDIAGRILADEELAAMTKVVRLPAIASKNGENRRAGEALWPERYPLDALDKIRKAVGPYDWASLYQCSPVRTESQEFKPEWYQYVSEEELASMQTARYLACDTAFSEKTSSDFCGFCDNEVDRENFWNLRAWRARLGPEEFCEALFTLQASRRYTKIGIEKTSYTVGLKPYLDAEQRRRNIFLPIVELDHAGTQKETRIRGVIPRYASGSVRHVEGRCDALEDEQMEFPNGAHDDVLDAEAYMTQLVDAPRSTTKVNRPKARRIS